MHKSFLKWLLQPHSVYLGKGGSGQKIRLLNIKIQKYESLVKLGVTDMKVIETRGDYVRVSIPSNSYDKFTHYHKLD